MTSTPDSQARQKSNVSSLIASGGFAPHPGHTGALDCFPIADMNGNVLLNRMYGCFRPKIGCQVHRHVTLENDSRDVPHSRHGWWASPRRLTPLPGSGYRFGRYFRTVATAWSTPATAPKSAMICLTVSLRGLPMWTFPEAQTLLEEPYGPEGRRAATGAAGSLWQSAPRMNNQNQL